MTASVGAPGVLRDVQMQIHLHLHAFAHAYSCTLSGGAPGVFQHPNGACEDINNGTQHV